MEAVIRDLFKKVPEFIHYFVDGWDEGLWKFTRTVNFYVFIITSFLLTVAWMAWVAVWLPTGIDIFLAGTLQSRLVIVIVAYLIFSFFGLMWSETLIDQE